MTKIKLRRKYDRYFILFGLVVTELFFSSCGVKGDPLPPDSPPPLSNGDMYLPKTLPHPKRLQKYDYNKVKKDEK